MRSETEGFQAEMIVEIHQVERPPAIVFSHCSFDIGNDSGGWLGGGYLSAGACIESFRIVYTGPRSRIKSL